ncbi:benzodiazepine receptor [Aureococcus anophagefferens]|nr:benzodiazepine receptor [Aureococcus anophagefferens]
MARSLCLSLVFAAASGFRLPSHRAKAAPRRAVVAAVAPAPAWVAGACLGGVLGTPFVVAATKTWPRAANALPKLAVAHYVGNLLWAPLFFKLKQFKAALGLNVALVASLVAVLPAFGAVGARALLLPYLAWLVFATVLNAEIVRLNPKGLVEANVGVDTLYS